MEPNNEFARGADQKEVHGRLEDEIIKHYMPGFWDREQAVKGDVEALKRLEAERKRRLEQIQLAKPFLKNEHLANNVKEIMGYNEMDRESAYIRFREYLEKDTKPLGPRK